MSIQVLVIVNPTSGRGDIIDYVDEIKENMVKQDMDVDLQLTKKGCNAKNIVENSIEGKDLLLICGGDGTLNEIVTALIEKEVKDVTVAYIPLGTTNDLARSLDMPIKDISITNRLLQSKARVIDIGKFNNDRYFCYVAAFGVMTDVSYKTSQKAKNKYGRLAYYMNAIKEIFKIKEHRVKIKFDDEELEGDFVYGSISNSESIAGFKWYNRNDINLEDGKFECLFIRKPKKLSGYIRLLSDFRRKDYMINRDFVYFKANHIQIETDEKLPWTIDGEGTEAINFVEIQNLNKAIELAICTKVEPDYDNIKSNKNNIKKRTRNTKRKQRKDRNAKENNRTKL